MRRIQKGCALLLALAMLALAGCTRTKPAGVRLEKMLEDDRNELKAAPWFCSVPQALDAFGLTVQDVAIAELEEGERNTLSLAAPVYLQDFGINAQMELNFHIDDGAISHGPILREVAFNALLPDEEAYRAFLQNFCDIADRPGLPFSADENTIERAVTGRTSFSQGSGGLLLFNETAQRKCWYSMRVAAGDLRDYSAGIAESLGHPIAVRLALWVSIWHDPPTPNS